MSDWREISGDQNLRLSQRMLEQQVEINNLKQQLTEALAEVERLRGERDEMHRKYMQLLETWERQQPVIETARAWRAKHLAAELNKRTSIEILNGLMAEDAALSAVVDALDVTTPNQDPSRALHPVRCPEVAPTLIADGMDCDHLHRCIHPAKVPDDVVGFVEHKCECGMTWTLLKPAARRAETTVEPCQAVSPGRDIHEAIAAWHDGDGDPEGKPLHEYLGMSWDEYKVWAETSELPEGSLWRDSWRAGLNG